MYSAIPVHSMLRFDDLILNSKKPASKASFKSSGILAIVNLFYHSLSAPYVSSILHKSVAVSFLVSSLT